ncbi:MAG TPA: LysE family transporter [Candidatus Omnitrophota bacterium]|nr:LysE family transporter [Candidatus Omnitrophota bacterium]HPS37576.1 LysE family transporter [Candidatus Omnitrophota bacterium]
MLFGILAGFLGSSLGWQINLIAINRGLRRGRMAAFLVGFGSVAADMIFLYVGLAGAAPLLMHPDWWRIIRWVGIVVLFSLAARTLLAHGKSRPEIEEVEKRNPTKNFLVGFLVVMTNPAVFLLWMGVVSFFMAHFPEMRQPWAKEFFLAGYPIGAGMWFGPLAFIFLKRLSRWGERNSGVTSKLSAALLILVALFLIFEKFKIS